MRTTSPTPLKPTRRRFLQTSAAAAAAGVGMFHIVPRHVLGQGQTPPSETVTHGVIGCGGISYSGAHMRPNQPGGPIRTIAVADPDANHLARKVQEVGGPVKGYADWRRVLEHREIDIIHICTPPHWHALMTVAAAQAGFDIWCEKPMSRTIHEGVVAAAAVEKYGRIYRLNTWFRFEGGLYGFGSTAKPIKQLVESGLLGWPLRVRVSRDTGFDFKLYWSGRTDLIPQPVPAHFDYDMWLGPAPYKPYHPHRTHGTFRGYWDYDGGGLADMGQHYLDPVQYLLGKDHTSPVEIEAYAPWPQHPDAAGGWGKVTMRYDDGCEIILESREWGEMDPEGQPYIEGPKGKLYRGFRTDPPDLAEAVRSLPQPEPMNTDFEECVKTRKKFALNEQNGHRSCCLHNLANIAIRTGRKLYYDPVKQQFQNDEEANRVVKQPMRAPWTL